MAGSGFDLIKERATSEWKIYIDTCSLYRTVEDGNAFWQRLEPILLDKGMKFTITTAVFSEFKKHKHGSNPEMQQKAIALERTLTKYGKKRMNLMLIAGDREDTFNDNAIVALIKQRCTKYAQIYITNDLANAWDVLSVVRLSQSSKRGVKPLLIYRVTGKGGLLPFDQLGMLGKLSQSDVSKYFELYRERRFDEAKEFLVIRSSGYPSAPQGVQRARRSKGAEDGGAAIRCGDGHTISVMIDLPKGYSAPKEGQRLRALRGASAYDVVLKKRIGRGGEGFVHEADVSDGSASGYLAKIYKKRVINDHTLAIETLSKIKFIVEGNYANKGGVPQGSKLGRQVKFPLMVLVNGQNEFVGYLMKRATGIKLSEFIAAGAIEDEFLARFPNLKKTDLIEMCLNFLHVMKGLHKREIIVGDLNANNIFVDTESNYVTLLDADSYQYGRTYPCNVGVEQYTAPEFLKNHDVRYRSVQNELFVIARILFEILMLVDNPYNSRCATDPITDMLNGTFRYTFAFPSNARQTNLEAPSKDLTIRWGHLTKSLKDAFGNTFHCDGAYWKPENRLGVDAWIDMLTKYKNAIERSVANGDGFESNDVFPKNKKAWVVSYRCARCNKTGQQDANKVKEVMRVAKIIDKYPETFAQNMCLSCLCEEYEVSETVCSVCSTPIYVLNSLQREPLCWNCFSKMRNKKSLSGRRSLAGGLSNESSASNAWGAAQVRITTKYVNAERVHQMRKMQEESRRTSLVESTEAGPQHIQSAQPARSGGYLQKVKAKLKEMFGSS